MQSQGDAKAWYIPLCGSLSFGCENLPPTTQFTQAGNGWSVGHHVPATERRTVGCDNPRVEVGVYPDWEQLLSSSEDVGWIDSC